VTNTLKVAFCQGHQLVNVLRATTATPIFTQAELGNDLPGCQGALAAGFPHI
jgi:hypothetical protein